MAGPLHISWQTSSFAVGTYVDIVADGAMESGSDDWQEAAEQAITH
jgi:hypothetical protein